MSDMTSVTLIILTKDNSNELSLTLHSAFSQQYLGCIKILIVESWINKNHLDSCVSAVKQLYDSVPPLTIIRIWPPIGIYKSMNYALSCVKTDTLLFLNSGDSFINNLSLSLLVSQYTYYFSIFLTFPPAVFGQSMMKDSLFSINWTLPPKKLLSISTWILFNNPCHQALLFSSDWHTLNPYNESVSLHSDRDIILLAISNHSHYKYLPIPIIRYDLNGVSTRPSLSVLNRTLNSDVNLLSKIVLFLRYILSFLGPIFTTLILIKSYIVKLLVNLASFACSLY